MPEKRVIAIVGKSLLMAGLVTSLKRESKFPFTHLELSLGEAAMELAIIAPDVIVFEMNDVNSLSVISILREHPRIKLIGFISERTSLIVIVGNEQPVRNTDELAQIIMG